jgi:MarR family 2-MHQ and catechol resistance regulon transcriptional repressor
MKNARISIPWVYGFTNKDPVNQASVKRLGRSGSAMALRRARGEDSLTSNQPGSSMPARRQGSARQTLALDTYVKLSRATNSLDSRLAPGLARAGLTESQFGVLEALLHVGPQHQCDLAERILKTSGNLTMVIGNLERRGLVRRARSTGDRRFIEVRLTRLIRTLFPDHAARLSGLMATLTEGEQRTLGRLGRKLGLGAAAATG